MAAFQLIMRTTVQGYHVYKEVWVPKVDEEFDCWQEADNRYAVAVYGDTQSSGAQWYNHGWSDRQETLLLFETNLEKSEICHA